MNNEKYVVVTTVSSYRIRYVVPMSELQKSNEELPVEPKWALDGVTCGDYEEFSQEYIDENIVDWTVENENEILQRFDKENDYLAEWTKKQKLELIYRNLTSKKGEDISA
jgi:hypothetical protein